MTEPQATDETPASAGGESGESARGEGEATRDLSLPELMRRAMLAQGKVDPDEVFAMEIDLDDDPSGDPGPEPDRPLPTEPLFEEERPYTWEP